jgi:hypothetical protein
MLLGMLEDVENDLRELNIERQRNETDDNN